MPIYEFVCMECESHFEELVRMDEQADCPDCGSGKVRKQFSVFAMSGGGAASEPGPAPRFGGGGCCGGSCGCH